MASPEILEEYRRVGLALAAGREPLVRALDALLAMIAVHALVVNTSLLASQVCEDPDDDKFLAAALAGAATVVVSGDKHLRRVSGWQSLDVLTPRQFVDALLEA